MLKWKKVDDSWFGNGFQVRRIAPSVWSLEHVNGNEAVDVSEPISQLSTLDACKYEAEARHRTQELAAKRRRLGAVAIGGWSLAVLAANPVLFIAAGVIGTAALLEIAAMWLDGRVGNVRDFVQ
ncbi:MAG TPA: hypothetical protein VEB69_10550 [Acidimicrobiia bacterium]|nr:hypothetical protein [Acidimicrobiia bacterium]